MVRLISRFRRELPVLFRQIVISSLYALPHVFRLLPAAAGASLGLLGDAVTPLLRALPKEADRISDDAVRRAIFAGFPYLWQRQLKKFLYVFSVLAVIVFCLLILLSPALVIGFLL